jgi:hypothetical protein
VARIVLRHKGMLAKSQRAQWLLACAFFTVVIGALLIGALLQQPS